ncbi:MAG TPA: tetratricopeptide repeat protein [Candidatus Polarisedimenticolia bacterium]|nr:tetratricopeptide repeat protein [Candidatus Polarisedimenticolia bacterium]
MARRVSIQPVALALLLAATVALAAEPAGVLVRYSFDDDNVATGPDTFAVYEAGRGRVELSSALRLSGYRSVEIRDVAGDGQFPELQGYFPLRRQGTLFAHFAFLTTDERETFNVALAGPEWFSLRRDGIGFWLQGRGGFLYQVSDSIPKKLLPLRSFVWYVVDLTYRVEPGTYDLTIRQEGQVDPIVRLADQVNAAHQSGSALDKFSFIGDTGEDTSNVVYYVDDVVLAADAPPALPPLAAPGRRKLFIDAWSDYRRALMREPGCVPPAEPLDFGINESQVEALRRQHSASPLEVATSATQPGIDRDPALPPDLARLLEAVSLWGRGCADLAHGEPHEALESFEKAERLHPGGRIYGLSILSALARLGRFDEVDARIGLMRPEWKDDPRFAVALAMIAAARDDLDQALAWLQSPADRLPEDRSNPALRRLWAGSTDADLMTTLRTAYRERADGYVRDALLAEQYFLVLLWKGSYQEAERYALRMAARLHELALPDTRWTERAGDAAFFMKDLAAARRRYESALRDRPGNTLLFEKLADVAYLEGDLPLERRYREKVFGTLEAKSSP